MVAADFQFNGIPHGGKAHDFDGRAGQKSHFQQALGLLRVQLEGMNAGCLSQRKFFQGKRGRVLEGTWDQTASTWIWRPSSRSMAIRVLCTRQTRALCWASLRMGEEGEKPSSCRRQISGQLGQICITRSKQPQGAVSKENSFLG